MSFRPVDTEDSRLSVRVLAGRSKWRFRSHGVSGLNTGKMFRVYVMLSEVMVYYLQHDV